MHVFFSGIGGAGLGPLALIAKQAGWRVSGSDKQDSDSIAYLRKNGIRDVVIGQTYEHLAALHARAPIDWFVFTSALPREQPDAPELRFCAEQHIRASKRDEFLDALLRKHHLKMVAVAGTHGKTTVTAMAVWALQCLGEPVSYSVGGKLSFGDAGHFDPASKYFVYEADEYDRNFLQFEPYLSVITGIDWDHPDVYPTREMYYAAFRDFLEQSRRAVLWRSDASRLSLDDSANRLLLDDDDPRIAQATALPGAVNRANAWLAAEALHALTSAPLEKITDALARFPGVARRFEQIAPRLYTDYAHTPAKIRGALQLAEEVAGGRVTVVYEGLHNTRQHFIKDDLRHLFDQAKQLYIVPSYLAREDPNMPLLTPDDLRAWLDPNTQQRTVPSKLDARLATAIRKHLAAGDTVLCLSAGGGGSLDEWLRRTFGAPDARPA